MDILNGAIDSLVSSSNRDDWTPVALNVADATVTISKEKVRPNICCGLMSVCTTTFPHSPKLAWFHSFRSKKHWETNKAQINGGNSLRIPINLIFYRSNIVLINSPVQPFSCCWWSHVAQLTITSHTSCKTEFTGRNTIENLLNL